MTDQRLLENVAKALGTELLLLGNKWRPLKSDADAFRLAVTLGITVMPVGPVVQAFKDGERVATEDRRDNARAATRRAIVRAAAALAPSKEGQPLPPHAQTLPTGPA